MYDNLNEKIMAAVVAANAAGLQHLAQELYSVGLVQGPAKLGVLADRVATIRTLLRLHPPAVASWRKCGQQFHALYNEVEIVLRSNKESQ